MEIFPSLRSVLRANRKDLMIVFLLLAFAYAYFYQNSKANGNSRFGLIFAIVQEGRLSIDSFYDTLDNGTSDAAYYNGHYYSDKAIGPALVGTVIYAPLYWAFQVFHHPGQNAAKEMITFLVIGLPSAIAGCLIYILSFYLSRSRFRAYLTTLAITLGTMYFPFSVVFFSHQFTSALLFGAFFLIFFMKEMPGPKRSYYFLLIGALLGWAFISEYPSAIIIAALIIYYLYILWKNPGCRNWRAYVLPILAGVIPLLLQLAYNKLCFGSYFSIGYANMEDPTFRLAMSKGIGGISWPDASALFYMTFHPTMGLFWQSPVLLLAFIGMGYAFIHKYKRYRGEAILAAGMIGAYLITISGYYMWWGGSSFAPRHLIPILPFFCLFLILVPKKPNWLFIGLTLISAGQMVIVAASTVLTPEKIILNIKSLGFFEYSNIYNFCLKQLESGSFTPNLGHRLLHLSSWASLIPFFVVIVGLTIFFLWNRKPAIQTTAASSRD